MGGVTTSDVFVPEVARDTIIAGTSDEGMPVLFGSEAVAVDGTLATQGALKVGRKLKIPYFGMIPDFQLDVPEGHALDTDKASETVEESEIQRAGVAIEYSTWTEMVMKGRAAGLDPYTLFSGQARERLRQMFERKLVTTGRGRGRATAGTPARGTRRAGRGGTWETRRGRGGSGRSRRTWSGCARPRRRGRRCSRARG
jgi:hypothetical protein